MFTDGIKRWVWVALGIFMAYGSSGCSQQTIAPHAQVMCPSERPQMCTRIYQPVCALVDTAAGPVWETRASDCTACADSEVIGYSASACR